MKFKLLKAQRSILSANLKKKWQSYIKDIKEGNMDCNYGVALEMAFVEMIDELADSIRSEVFEEVRKGIE